MRILVNGSPSYRFSRADHRRLDALHAAVGITAVVSGGGLGADLGGELWAAIRGVPIRRVVASDVRPEANLSAIADAVVVFPGAKPHALACAAMQGLALYDWRRDAERESIMEEITVTSGT